ncbi:MAG: DUF5666 domain-containing protein [Chloroflexi bacterium]|nr:DUF5666 domain-containing protein [Chloroflexota bacterium]
MMHKLYVFTFAVLMVSIGLGALVPAKAQEKADEYDLEISGVLQEINEDNIVISGVTILIAENTELSDDLEVDAKVDAYVNYVDEEFTAVGIELDDDKDEDENDRDGPLATEEPVDGPVVTDEPADSPEVTEEPSDGPVVTEEPDDDDEDRDDDEDDEDEDEELEFTGTLDEIDTAFIVLSGVTIQLNDMTEIEDELVVGEKYEVEIDLDENTFIAEEIELDDEDDDDERDGPIGTEEPDDDGPVGTEEAEDNDDDRDDDNDEEEDDGDNSGRGSGNDDDDREEDDEDD